MSALATVPYSNALVDPQVSRLQAAAAARDSQLDALRTEREALLDFAQVSPLEVSEWEVQGTSRADAARVTGRDPHCVHPSVQDAQRRQTEAAATASALESVTASDSANAQRLAAMRQTVEAQASRIRLLESQLSAADARAGEAAARIEELQACLMMGGNLGYSMMGRRY